MFVVYSFSKYTIRGGVQYRVEWVWQTLLQERWQQEHRATGLIYLEYRVYLPLALWLHMLCRVLKRIYWRRTRGGVVVLG